MVYLSAKTLVVLATYLERRHRGRVGVRSREGTCLGSALVAVVQAVSGGGQRQMPVRNALRAQDDIGDRLDKPAFAAQDDHLHADVRIKMDVHRGDDLLEVFMLNGVELLSHRAGMVVVHDSERAHHLFARQRAFFLCERVTHQIAYHFAAVLGEAALGHQGVEAHEQALGHGHREAGKVLAHR